MEHLKTRWEKPKMPSYARLIKSEDMVVRKLMGKMPSFDNEEKSVVQ
jgi:hypothetical protein